MEKSATYQELTKNVNAYIFENDFSFENNKQICNNFILYVRECFQNSMSSGFPQYINIFKLIEIISSYKINSVEASINIANIYLFKDCLGVTKIFICIVFRRVVTEQQ